MKNTKKKIGGISANKLVIPIILILSILHIIIIISILKINRHSTQLSVTMQNSGKYTQEATSILGGSSLLSETASHYVLMPLTEGGDVNVSPLIAYAEELTRPRRGSQVLERFRNYDVEDDVMKLVEKAADSAEFMLNNQIHAISLIRTIHPFPEEGLLASIPKAELTEEELKMTDAEKLAEAKMLVLGSEYGQNKQAVSKNVSECTERLQQLAGMRSAEAGRRIMMYRILLWTVTALVIAILIYTFLSLYRHMMIPLNCFVKLITEGSLLDEDRGFREVRMVAHAYNDVLKRRDALDGILRSAAETDALTNLQNRYSFERYRMDLEDRGGAVAVLLFDINYLKKTNDTQGHAAGDRLIREAADCIAACFGDEGAGNCFRFGGDEFAAVVKNCTREKIRLMIDRFTEMEKEHGVSVSMGYAYTDDIGKKSFKQLLDEADRKMYVYKRRMHNNHAETV